MHPRSGCALAASRATVVLSVATVPVSCGAPLEPLDGSWHYDFGWVGGPRREDNHMGVNVERGRGESRGRPVRCGQSEL